MKSIGLKPKLLNIEALNINRATQLCLKTNQFNLRVNRYTVQDLLKIENSNEYVIKLSSLEDKYGDHGIVGLYCLKKINKDFVFIDEFLMSCRAIDAILKHGCLCK